MPRLTVVAVVLAAAAALAGCGSSGGGGTTAAPAATGTAQGTAPATTQGTSTAGATGGTAAGKAIFTSAGCSGCHTLKDAASTGAVGPNLDELEPSEAAVETQVTSGGGGMPSFKGTLSAAQIKDVAQYVSSVAGS